VSKLTGVSLFAGVGGFDLAMERNGVDVVASVEIDKKCKKYWHTVFLIANYLMM